MFASEDFTYDGQKASSFGLKLVRMNSSLFIEDQIAGPATLEETELPYDFKTHIYRVKRDPLEFRVQLALADRHGIAIEWTAERKRAIFGWIFQNRFKELIFDDEPEVCYYAMASSELMFYSTEGKGYIELTLKTNSPYAWVLPQKVIIKGKADAPTVVKALSLEGRPRPVFERVYLKVLFTRIPGSVQAPSLTITTQPNYDIITLRPDRIETGSLINPNTPVDRIIMDGERKTIWEVDKDLNRVQSLYSYRDPTRGDRFPYLTYSHSGVVQLTAGWDVEIEYQYPIIR